MSEQNTIRVTLHNGPAYDAPDKMNDFIDWLRSIRNKAPHNFRSEVEIEFINDDYSTEIDIEYRRPETDLEMSARAQAKEGRRASIERQERTRLAELKRKYPNSEGDGLD